MNAILTILFCICFAILAVYGVILILLPIFVMLMWQYMRDMLRVFKEADIRTTDK